MPAKAKPNDLSRMIDGLLVVARENFAQQGGFTLFGAAFDRNNDAVLFNIATRDAAEAVPFIALEPLPAKDKKKPASHVWRDRNWSDAVKRLAKHVQSADFTVCGLCSPSRVALAEDPDTIYEAAYCHAETPDGEVRRVVVPLVGGGRKPKFGDQVILPGKPCLFAAARRRA
jgi:hypothetical protein